MAPQPKVVYYCLSTPTPSSPFLSLPSSPLSSSSRLSSSSSQSTDRGRPSSSSNYLKGCNFPFLFRANLLDPQIPAHPVPRSPASTAAPLFSALLPAERRFWVDRYTGRSEQNDAE